MSWTDERVALLKKLWGEGKTAAEIAKELGNTTRNAVIGKAHRLKLSKRVSPIQQNRKSSKKKKETKEKTPPKSAKKSAKKSANSNKKEGGIPMEDLTNRTCRWPYGDPQKEDFSFCGDTPTEGMPYCEEHAHKAYKLSSRKKKSKEKSGSGKKAATG